MNKCPQCNKSSGVRKIIYGFSVEPIDEKKYELGGCLLDKDSPKYTCVNCKIKWNSKKQFEKSSNFEVSSEEMQKITIDIILGVPKDESRVKINTPELEEIYNLIKKEVNEAHSKGYVIDFPNLGVDFEEVNKIEE